MRSAFRTKLKIMKEILLFTEIDGDVMFELEYDHNFNIGDYVYYILPSNVKDQIKYFYPNSDVEGTITSKWIDLNDRIIKWTVEVDFVNCYDADA